MKNPGIYRILLIAGIVANIAILGILPSINSKAFDNITWQPYVSKDGGFGFNIPAHWKIRETSHKGEVVNVRISGPRNTLITMKVQFVPNMDILLSTQVFFPSVESFSNMSISSMAEEYRFFEHGQTRKTKVGGREACITEITYRTWDAFKGMKKKGIVVTAWCGGVPILIKMTCLASAYENALPVFQNILNSYQHMSSDSDEIEDAVGTGELSGTDFNF